MLYLLAVVMGYFVGTNAYVERRVQTPGMAYGDPIMGALSFWGMVSAIPCVLVSSYFLGSAEDNSFWNGLGFFACVQGGMFLAGFKPLVSKRYLISVLALPVNIFISGCTYVATRFFGAAHHVLSSSTDGMSAAMLLGTFAGVAVDPMRVVICLPCGWFIKNRWVAIGVSVAITTVLTLMLVPERFLDTQLSLGAVANVLLVWVIHLWKTRKTAKSSRQTPPEAHEMQQSIPGQAISHLHRDDQTTLAAQPESHLTGARQPHGQTTLSPVKGGIYATIFIGILACGLVLTFPKGQARDPASEMPLTPQPMTAVVKAATIAPEPVAQAPTQQPTYQIAYAGPQGAPVYTTEMGGEAFYTFPPGTMIPVLDQGGDRLEGVARDSSGQQTRVFVSRDAISSLPITTPREGAEKAVVATSENHSADATHLYPTSFDCGKASSQDEQIICQDPEIAKMDRDMALVYADIKQNHPEADIYTVSQREWLSKRKLCGDRACLVDIYQDRLNVLRNAGGAARQ